jgi:hypothetical protein
MGRGELRAAPAAARIPRRLSHHCTSSSGCLLSSAFIDWYAGHTTPTAIESTDWPSPKMTANASSASVADVR